MSFSLENFSAYFSATGKPRVIVNKDRHTESSLVDLLGRKSEDRK